MGRRMTNLPRYVRRHGEGFRAVLRIEGRDVRGPTFTTPREAGDWAERLRTTPVPGMPWALQDGYDALMAELELTARPATIAYYRNHWRVLTNGESGHFDAARLVCTITPKDILKYARCRRDDGVSDSTTWKELQVLGRVLRLAKRERQIADDPLEQVPRPKIRQRRFEPLSSKTMDALLTAIRGWGGQVRTAERDADIIDLIFSSGIRLSEAARLTPADVSMDTDELRIDGKTGIRRLPIGDHIRPILARLMARAGGADRPLVGTVRILEGVFRRWQDRVEEPRLHAHALRHSFATARARAGVDPYVLRDLLGHATLKETMRYYHTQSDKMRAAMDAVPRKTNTPAEEPKATDAG